MSLRPEEPHLLVTIFWDLMHMAKLSISQIHIRVNWIGAKSVDQLPKSSLSSI